MSDDHVDGPILAGDFTGSNLTGLEMEKVVGVMSEQDSLDSPGVCQ